MTLEELFEEAKDNHHCKLEICLSFVVKEGKTRSGSMNFYRPVEQFSITKEDNTITLYPHSFRFITT
jgi:hypothetical protein